MAITLGELRTFTREIASPDSSGATAEREFMVWINSAIMRVYADNDWDKILHQQHVNIVPEESGDSLAATQDSLAVTMVAPELFEQKYIDEEWDLILAPEGTQFFQLASKTTDQIATLREGDEWLQVTQGSINWTALKTKYVLPDKAKTVTRVQVMQDGGSHVEHLANHEFDLMKGTLPVDRGSWPRWYTLRQGKIEIYPHPGPNRTKLGLTYRKAPPVLADAALDAVTIDWDEEWKDLLYKAIQLEASITQGRVAPIPFPLAFQAYDDRLKKYKALDNNKSDLTGPMGLRHPVLLTRPIDISFSDRTPILDVGPP